jgi:hypothetical protein
MSDLGLWLKINVTKQRNVVRFLLPKTGASSIYEDKEVVILTFAATAVIKAAKDSCSKGLAAF